MKPAADSAVLPRQGGAITPERSLQLDLFRGIAAIFMIINHAGYQLLGAAASTQGWAAWLVFIGSAAPALFFFATGVGSGFSGGGGEAFGSLARKVILLVLADTLLNWSHGVLLAFDFFGFAAVATLCLFLVRQTSRPTMTASLLLVLVLVMRFGLVSWVQPRTMGNPLLAFITGVTHVHDVSYPLGPWLAFPLLGFLTGRSCRARAITGDAWFAGLTGLFFLGAAAALALRGAPVFRWGTVSLAYFLCAIGIVAVAWLVTDGIVQVSPVSARPAALRGPASLLIVPLHYAALGILETIVPAPWNGFAWLGTTLVLTCVVLLLSRMIIAVGGRIQRPSTNVQVLLCFVTGSIGLAACVGADPLARLELCSAGEVVIGLLLLWSGSQPGAAVPLRGSSRRAVERP